MAKLLNFSDFLQHQINEANNQSELVPLQILMRGNIGLTAKSEDFTKGLMKRLYDKYINLVLIRKDDEYNTKKEVPDNRKRKINFDLPILNFTSTKHDFLENKKAKVFNSIEGLQFSADKKVFHETFKDADFVPKAVFKLDEIDKLKEPIIAKPAEGFSAQGIELFKTYKEAKDSKLKFDLWSEAKEIDREFRAFIMNGEVILISERITNTKNDKSVGKKDADDKIDLVYIDQKLKDFPHLKDITRIQKEVQKEVELEFFNLDLILDKDGKLWVPEINGAPGIGPSMFYHIYKGWMELTGNKMSKETESELISIMKEHRDKMKGEYPTEYKNSLLPKTKDDL